MQLNLTTNNGKERIDDKLIFGNLLTNFASITEYRKLHSESEYSKTQVYYVRNTNGEYKLADTPTSIDKWETYFYKVGLGNTDEMYEPYGDSDDGVYATSDTSKGVHHIKLSRHLEDGEYIIISWNNDEEIKIVREKKYKFDPISGLIQDGYETKIYSSYGGSYNEIGVMDENYNDGESYTFEDLPNRYDYSQTNYLKEIK